MSRQLGTRVGPSSLSQMAPYTSVGGRWTHRPTAGKARRARSAFPPGLFDAPYVHFPCPSGSVRQCTHGSLRCAHISVKPSIRSCAIACIAALRRRCPREATWDDGGLANPIVVSDARPCPWSPIRWQTCNSVRGTTAIIRRVWKPAPMPEVTGTGDLRCGLFPPPHHDRTEERRNDDRE